MTTAATLRVQMIDGASATTAKIVAATDRLNAAQLRSAQAAQVVAAGELQAAQAAVEAASSAEELAEAELRAGRAAERLAREEIKAAQASERMAAASREAAASSDSVAAAAAPARTGMFGVTDAAKKQGFAMAGQVNAVAELAFNFGNLSPATRGLGMAFVMAGGNAFAFAGMLGPLGVVLGVMVGIIPGLIDLARHLGDEFEDAGSKAAAAATKMNELVDARLQDLRAAQRQRDIASGAADSDEIEVQIEELGAQSAAARRRAAGARLGIGADGGPADRLDIFRGLFDSDTRSGLLDALGGMVTGGGSGARRAQAQNLAESQRLAADSSRLREDALPVARAREEQERLEQSVGVERQRQSAAARRFALDLDQLGLSDRRRQAIEQAAGSGRADIELPALVRGLPADVQDRIRSGADLVADANAGVTRAQIEADAGPLRQLEQARRDRRALGERQGTVTIDSASGAGGATRSEFQLAETSVPGVEAVGRETNDLLREMIREQRLTRENARRTTTRVDAGPDPLGDSG